jgi:2-polyprenyl-3-methyl-5-hydroxy-6-metoxy-1,4-benzoquinol methylase
MPPVIDTHPYQCKCCGATATPQSIWGREMMYGSREPFLYYRCAACGSLQIATVPEDMSVHYAATRYPNWSVPPSHVTHRRGPVQRALRRWRTAHALGRRTALGAWLTERYGPPEFPFDWTWLTQTGTSVDDVVLDFGCGAGVVLYYLRACGFAHLHGYDKFAPLAVDEPDLHISDRLSADLEGRCHLVMSHHSLEHVPDPLATLVGLSTFVAPGGWLLVRIPVASSFAAIHYGRDWVQLDAPRHLVIPSDAGMRALAKRAGLAVIDVRYDSTAFQFLGSEQYRADIPMYDEQRSWMRGRPSTLDDATCAGWRARAKALNDEGMGDQACFYLRHAADAAAPVPHRAREAAL